MSDIKFPDGLIVKPPHERAPDFVKASISIKVEDLMKWLAIQNTEWVNLDVKESKQGKWYASVNDWQPKQGVPQPQAGQNQEPPASTAPDFDDDIPFMRYEFNSVV